VVDRDSSKLLTQNPLTPYDVLDPFHVVQSTRISALTGGKV